MFYPAKWIKWVCNSMQVCDANINSKYARIPIGERMHKHYILHIGRIEKYIFGRKQRVVVNGIKSAWGPVLSGIPQGTVLGPILFLAFVNDLPSTIQSRTLMFADDTAVYSKSATTKDREQPQQDLDVLNLWLRRWLLPFNAVNPKSFAIV